MEENKEVVKPLSIEESEQKQLRAKLEGSREKEIARRCQIDPQKDPKEVAAEYDAKVAEEAKKAHPAKGEGIAHSSEAGIPVDKQ